jgi:hypothetical protein
MSRRKLFNVRPDQKFSPENQRKIGRIRGGMVDAAERNPLPARFVVRQHEFKPHVIILDRETGQEASVALCDYYGARKLLNDLFGEHQS